MASFLGILRSSLYYLAAFLPSYPPSLPSLLRRRNQRGASVVADPFYYFRPSWGTFVLHVFLSSFTVMLSEFEVVAGLNGNIDIHFLAALSLQCVSGLWWDAVVH